MIWCNISELSLKETHERQSKASGDMPSKAHWSHKPCRTQIKNPWLCAISDNPISCACTGSHPLISNHLVSSLHWNQSHPHQSCSSQHSTTQNLEQIYLYSLPLVSLPNAKISQKHKMRFYHKIYENPTSRLTSTLTYIIVRAWLSLWMDCGESLTHVLG